MKTKPKTNPIAKLALLLALLTTAVPAAQAQGATAQDTIQSNGLKPNYFYNNWIGTNTIETHYIEAVFSLSHPEFNFKNSALNAKYFFTEDSLTIYGMAVMLDIAAKDELAPQIEDTSTTASYEYFSIYRAGSEHPEPYSDSLWIHFFNTPPTYYLRMVLEDLDTNYTPPDVEVHPVWETYFKEPYTVKDSFYLASTSTSYIHNFQPVGPNYFIYDHWPVVIVGFQPVYENMTYMTQPWPEKICSYITERGWVCDSMPVLLYFFPILHDSNVKEPGIFEEYILMCSK